VERPNDQPDVNRPVRHTDWDYEVAHRTASEALIAATDSAITEERALELLDEAQKYGRRALEKATNIRQKILEAGFLQTVLAERLAIEYGFGGEPNP